MTGEIIGSILPSNILHCSTDGLVKTRPICHRVTRLTRRVVQNGYAHRFYPNFCRVESTRAISELTARVFTQRKKDLLSTEMAASFASGDDTEMVAILSIDGGGIRGMIPAVILEAFEQQLQKEEDERKTGHTARIAHYFDAIGGTSTGGLIAAMLAAPVPGQKLPYAAKDIVSFYKERAKYIFKPSGWWPEGWFHADRSLLRTEATGSEALVAEKEVRGIVWPSQKYIGKNIRKEVNSKIGDETISETLTDLVIPTFDVYLEHPIIFSTDEASTYHKEQRWVDPHIPPANELRRKITAPSPGKPEKRLLTSNQPPQPFQFTHFADLHPLVGRKTYLTDVIGMFEYLGQTKQLTSTKKIREVFIRNTRDEALKIIFCDENIGIIPQTLANDGSTPILAVTSTTVSNFGGTISVNVSQGTKVFVDPNIPAAAELKAKITAQSPGMPQKRLLTSDAIRTIKDVHTALAKETMGFNLCRATIQHVYKDEGWKYHSCTKCRRKVTLSGNNYWCFKCNTEETNPDERFKLQLRIGDGYGVIDVTAFSEAAGEMLEISMKDMNAINEKGKKDPSKNAKVADICIGTSAAPTYFPAHSFDVANKSYNLIDGGLAANNPTECVMSYVSKKLKGDGKCFKSNNPIKPNDYSKFLVISLGTGDVQNKPRYTAKEVANWGVLGGWLRLSGPQPLLDFLRDGSTYMVDYAVQSNFDNMDDTVEKYYLRIQTTELNADTAQIDNVEKENLRNLEELGRNLLEEKVKKVNLDTGKLEYIPEDNRTNRDALSFFAKQLVDQRIKKEKAAGKV